MTRRPRIRVLFRPEPLFVPGFPWVWICEACEGNPDPSTNEPDTWTKLHWQTLSDCCTNASAHARSCPAIKHFTLTDRLVELRDNLEFNHRRQAKNRKQLGDMPYSSDLTRVVESGLIEWCRGAEFAYGIAIDKISQLITEASNHIPRRVTCVKEGG